MPGINYDVYANPRLDLGEAMREFDVEKAMFIADQVLPVFETPRKEASFSKIKREDILKSEDAKRAPRASYNRIGIGGDDEAGGG